MKRPDVYISAEEASRMTMHQLLERLDPPEWDWRREFETTDVRPRFEEPRELNFEEGCI